MTEKLDQAESKEVKLRQKIHELNAIKRSLRNKRKKQTERVKRLQSHLQQQEKN